MPTLVLLKPDAVARGLTFEISERFEKRGQFVGEFSSLALP